MKPAKEKLTIKHLNRPLDIGQDDRFQWDSEVPGFALRTRRIKKSDGSPSNEPPRETWCFLYRNKKMTLGQASALKPQQAREMARQHYAKTVNGGDPLLEKQTNIAKNADTFGQLVTRFLDWQRGRLRPSSMWQVERFLGKFATPLHRLPVSSVDRKQIAALLATIERDSGAVSSNRARSALSSCFAWGLKEGLVTIPNPVPNTNKREEKERDRVLSASELRLIWNAAPGNHYGAIVRLLMLTGQRFSEIAGLRWSEIDFDHGVIRLPRNRVKNDHAHEIPMSPTVKALLTAQPRNGRETVFSVQSQARCKLALDNAIAKANNGAPIEPWIHHDMRRTFATGAAEIGILPHIIEAVLNHQSGHKGGVAGIYNHAVYRRDRTEALDRWDQHLSKIVS
jgi:integrase